METKKVLREQLDNAKQEAIKHMKKLDNIESIIRVGQSEKIPSIFILDRIKKVIWSK